MAADQMYVSSGQVLRKRVSDFNQDLSKKQEADYWPRMMGSAKYFIYDSATGNFAHVKYAGYMAAEKNGIYYRHINISIYRQISKDRAGSTFNGSDVWRKVQKAAGQKFKPATDFPSKQAEKLGSDFFSWYRKHFNKSNDFIDKRFAISKFIWLCSK